jgi:Xaa-Pro aminopeptidase
MKSDIDSLMQANGIDAILVTGPGDHNPAMTYLTGGKSALTNADILLLRGQAPVLFHSDIERDEAAASGLLTKNLANYHPQALLNEVKGDLLQYNVQRYQLMLNDIGLTSGRVALYGRMDAGRSLAIFTELQRAMPGLTFVPEGGNTVLMQAMATKDESEVAHIRRMGQITTAVVGQTAEFLTSQRVKDETLVQADGSPLTIGDVKRRINLWLAEAGTENPEGTIFAMGYDAAVPHSSGAAEEALRLGQTIIFDIFPCEQGGGYFYDFTRTWCLGYAPDPAMALYEDVLYVFRAIMSELQAGAPTRQYMERACQLFEGRGHPSPRSHPQTQEGFVHGLGHGVGLNIHELPQFSLYARETECVLPGVVMTVEPGLYYPERQIGVRLEDTVWVRPDGQVETLAEFPLDFVLSMKH